jgi:branched-chain amino acid aminotransferase
MNLADRDGFIWQDGQMVDWRDAKIHVLTHTLHYSMGVFEGVRAYETPKVQQFSVSKTTLNVC